MTLLKYPRTRHLEGSRLQIGDKADDKPLAELKGSPLVVEEKLDGANSGISFNSSGALQLQSRGHYLQGGGRERHFALLKTWAATHAHRLLPVLQDRYVMYGEWLYAKHTVFYDALSHYFFEFDVYDRQTANFLSTSARRTLLEGLPIMPVPVLKTAEIQSQKELLSLVQPSLYKSPDWRVALVETAQANSLDAEEVSQKTEDSDLAEGLYLKQESGDRVLDRFKFVRGDFLQAILDSDDHWHSRPILPNQLKSGVDIFAPRLALEGAYDA